MLRALLLIIALLILIAIALTALGIIDLRQTQHAQAPEMELKVNDIDVGTTTANVALPTVEMKSRQVEVPAVTVDRGNSQ
jgi:hypothetical protein